MDGSLRKRFQGQKNIEFTGPVYGKSKEAAFKNNDILVVPSLAQETFGIVIAEGYAYGLPVIATQVGALPEIVDDGFSGLLVEPNSLDSIQEALFRVKTNPGLVQAMSENAFEQAKKYSSEVFLENYLSLYVG